MKWPIRASNSLAPGTLNVVSGARTPKASAQNMIKDVYAQFYEELCRGGIKNFKMSRVEAEDVVQTAFIRYAEVTVVIDNPRAFLYRACSNIAIDQIRRRQVQNHYVQSVVDSESRTVEEIGPERVVEGCQRMGIISKALWGMPNKRRQLLVMSRFDGLSYAEIGRRVNISEAAVRKHVANALLDCQQALQTSTR